MGMSGGGGQGGLQSEINVTPMVDIMLVLLIIFMVVTPFLQQGITVALLKNMKKDEDRIVYIKSGVGVSYGDVVTVINEVRKLGVDKIGLVADKKKGGAAAPKPAA